jgi:hypothetical protein
MASWRSSRIFDLGPGIVEQSQSIFKTAFRKSQVLREQLGTTDDATFAEADGPRISDFPNCADESSSLSNGPQG